tara:strand:+ start:52 stop:441 length:390 start_codon:yes stop_codon:yes gene_type:complete
MQNHLLRYKANTIEMGNYGIVYFRAEADDVYTDLDLIAILDLAEEAAEGKPFLLLMMVNEFKFLMTKEARNLFNTYKKAMQFIKAEAVLVKSVPSKIMYNLLTKLHSPKFPFKAFAQEKIAVAWLLKQS